MLSKIQNGLRLIDIKRRNAIYRFLHEEKGASEIIAVVIIVVVVLGLVILFKDKLETLVKGWLDKIDDPKNQAPTTP